MSETEQATKVTLLEPPSGEFVAPVPGTLVVWPNGARTMYCPRCGKAAALDDHKLEVKDGSVTIAPSLVCPRQDCKAHYHVKQGRIEWL